jgi:zinc D-Ala-D-Ala carboxypeptidase
MNSIRALGALLLVLVLVGCGGGADATRVAPDDSALPASSPPVVPPPALDPPSGGSVEPGDGDLGGGRVSPWDDVAATSRLDPELLAALRQAAEEASADGVVVEVTSGWRSREFQQRLLDEAVVRYGSAEEAARWVATPDTSAHVTGHAVDVGPTDAAYWMAEHGPEFGLCQVYANEIWHYERLVAPGGECPALRADGTS